MTKEFRKSYFGIQAVEGGIFQGYTKGENWNGWECPYFTFEQATKVMEGFNLITDYKGRYDKDTDTFFMGMDDGEKEIFTGQAYTIGDSTHNLYAIGSFSWIWEEIENVSYFKDVSHFGGDVVLSHSSLANNFIYVELWAYSEVPTYWSVTIENNKIRNAHDILLELKKPNYETEGWSVDITGLPTIERTDV